METSTPQFVPKIHPATRGVEPEDPMTLHATPVVGDPEVMLRCVVQEYAWMGWNAERVFGLFHDPFFPVLNGLLQYYGEAGIRERIVSVLGRCGVFQFKESVCEDTDPAEQDHEPELVQLRVPERLCRERPPWRSETGAESELPTTGTAQRPSPTNT